METNKNGLRETWSGSCLDNPQFTESTTGTCLSVWIEGTLGLPEWPARLDELLKRLPPGTYLRNATMAISVAHYRADKDERASARLLDVLAPHLVSAADERTRKLDVAKVKEPLGKSRRAYQGGLIAAPRGALALPPGNN